MLNLREHSRLLVGAAAGLVITIFLTLPGCGATADPLGTGKKINSTQLAQEVNTQQSVFDQRAAVLNQSAQNALSDYANDAAALKAKYAKAAAQLQSDTSKYNSDVQAFNANVDAAQQDLAKQASMRAEVVNVAGGLLRAATGSGFDPAAAIGTALTAVLGGGFLGSLADSASKSKTLVVKNQTIAQLTAGGGSDPAAAGVTPANVGAPGLVQTGAPAVVPPPPPASDTLPTLKAA